MKTTLLVLAAGMGSRYGGIKQLDKMGPNGETIMDYSIFDAIQAGFNKIVFVIRQSFEKEFRTAFVDKLQNKVEVNLAFQDLNDIPEGLSFSNEREKPWGTAHAIWAARNVINEPFAAINADDFYGRDAFDTMSQFLKSPKAAGKNYYSMCGYMLENTLSEHGSVSRGICQTDDRGLLISIAENTHIQTNANGIIVNTSKDGKVTELNAKDTVSMNFWGFTPDIFSYIEEQFREFIKNNGNDSKAEIYIPFVVDELIQKKLARTEVLKSNAKWFGVTYAEDKIKASENIRSLIRSGLYPDNLWG
jgi:NDP-sugar pyrophosphorylase family protein